VRETQNPSTMQTLKNVCNDSVPPVIENGITIMFDNGHSLGDCLTVVPPPGHVCIDLHSKEQSTVFCGDILHNSVQVRLWHWNTVFFDNPTQAKQSRHDMLSLCAESGALRMPMYFGQLHAARVKSKYGTFSLDFTYR
jgi:glyoxylase-like metal-dependent hydrolase (beta-lactamase superfamily II)